MPISEKEPNGHGLGPTEKMEIHQKTDYAHTIEMTAEDMTNEAVPSTTKKINSCCMKMSEYRMITSSDIFNGIIQRLVRY